ncbi:uncharacterized protein LOC131439138 [Malaya genurostris]|uniref:uncharacterized protein LOC131439138 n=1 Tax=Malaya genurostris TaxID=325434 RepID=UPI0026F39EDB|nr:uncharacterized protein LOC131439138 [Malaya genurostris]
MSTSGDHPTGSCKVCNRPDHAEDMVACDCCEKWFHFTCAGVQASICNKPWRCGYCSSRDDDRNSTVSICSTTSSARLRLRQLKEAKTLDDRLLLQQAERERAYLAEKHQLEAEIHTEMRLRTSTSSRISCKSSHSHRTEIKTWIDQSGSTMAVNPNADAKASTPVISIGNIVQADKNKSVITPVQSISTGIRCSVVPSTSTKKAVVEFNRMSTKTHVPPIPISGSAYTSQHNAVRLDQQKQHPSGPSKQHIPPTSQSGPREGSQLGAEPIMESQVPVRTDSGERNQLDILCKQRTVQQQFGNRNSSYFTQPRGNQSGTSFMPSLPPEGMQLGAEPIMESQVPVQNDSGERSQFDAFGKQQTVTPQLFDLRRGNIISHPKGNQAGASFVPPFYSTHWPVNENLSFGNSQQQTPFMASIPVHPYTPSNYLRWFASGAPNMEESNASRPRTSATASAEPLQSEQGRPDRQSNMGQSSNNHCTSATEGVLNAQQWAARQVVSRDLPKFSGDPLEWPLFINAFESTTMMCGIQQDENLARLQKSLVGSAREKVQSILTLPAAIPEIIQTLRDECGRPEQLVHCLLVKIRHAPPPNINKLDTLINFGREVKNLVIYIEGAKLHDHLANPMLLSELVGKLPPNLRLEWGLHTQKIPEVSLKAFSEYVTAIRTAACKVLLPDCSHDEGRRSKKEKGGFVSAHSFGQNDEIEIHSRKEHQTKTKNATSKSCAACNENDHKLRNCDKFKNLSLDQRRKLVERLKLCQHCLGSHGKWPCRSKQLCEIDGCKEYHNSLLHTKPIRSVQRTVSTGVISAHCSNQESILFKVIPVILSHKGKSISTFAFLDDGSNLTLMEEEIAEELELNGNVTPLCIQWTGSVTRKESTSREVQVSISGTRSQQYTISGVRTAPRLDLPHQSLDYDYLANRFAHLKRLPVSSYSNAIPRILIGLDNAKLIMT